MAQCRGITVAWQDAFLPPLGTSQILAHPRAVVFKQFNSFLFSRNLFISLKMLPETPIHKLDKNRILLVESNLGKGEIHMGRAKFYLPILCVPSLFGTHTV